MTQTYRAVPGVLTREVGGELLLLNSDSELYFALNSTGAAMYHLLLEGHPSDRVVTSVAMDFGVSETTVEADLAALLARLVDNGLILPDG